ncbi:MAG TPA: 4-alpha-glucanotransferase [Acidimicrobiales bacterium]|nr:4-alpha-glucanotransferase [Acidimicrobiales bacterium]
MPDQPSPNDDHEPNPWGVDPGYKDIDDEWHDAPASTVRAILEAMGADAERPAAGPPVWIVREGERVDVAGRWELQTEDGGSDRVAGSLVAPPPGYHWLYRETDGRGVRLIVTPGKCHLPMDLKAWGWAVQLYALRSAKSWGMGDLGDLRRLGEWSASKGAELLLLNPLHASIPVPGSQQSSPYYPSSRCFRSPLYLRIEDVPGATVAGVDLEELATAGRGLNESRAIDRDTVLELKLDALRRIHAGFEPHDEFDAFVRAGGDTLHRFAVHCALAEEHGGDWRMWPVDYRHSTTFEVRQFAKDEPRKVGFHLWVQWLVDRQLEAAGSTIGLMQDLAIGVDPGGADAWLWQDVLAPGISVGAPPDEYNTQGQDWGLPPFDPWKLRDAAYEPFIETVRAGFRHAGGLRFDHVMGLFRLYWIPQHASAKHGTYVRYPFGDLLDILALESHRAGAYVVGEDLGTVEDSMREELADRNVLSYRLFWFEDEPPSSFPSKALGAVTTHDLPTIAGLWTGSDLEAQRLRRMSPNDESTEALRDRVQEWTGLAPDAPVTEVSQRVHELLAEAPSAILTATLDDAIGVEERPNYPGTTDETNWSVALPMSLEDIEDDPRVAEIARALTDR